MPGATTFTLTFGASLFERVFEKEIKADFAVEYEFGAPINSSPAIDEIKVIDPFFLDINFEKTLIEFSALEKLVFHELSHSFFEKTGSSVTDPLPTFEIKTSILLLEFCKICSHVVLSNSSFVASD